MSASHPNSSRRLSPGDLNEPITLSAARGTVLHIRRRGGACAEINLDLPEPAAEATRYPAAMVEQVREPGSVAVTRGVPCAVTIRTIGCLMETLNPTVARVLKRLHFPLDVIVMCVRWYMYQLSLRHLE